MKNAYFALLLIISSASLFAADTAAKKQSTPVAAPMAQTQVSASSEPVVNKSPSAVTAVTEAAVKQGVLACSRRIEQLARAINTNAKSGTYFFPPAAQPDHGLFSASMEVKSQDNPSLYASVSFAPNPSGGCDAVYDAVEYLPQSCTEVQKKSFAASSVSPILKDIGVYNAGAVKVFFMQAGTGCVVMKKEVLN